MLDLPGCKGCDGLRRDEDGSIWLTRPNKNVEAYLDRRMLRVRPGELRWVEIPQDAKHITQADAWYNVHEGMVGLMLGKGPSLDRFIEEYPRARWHVVPIAINEAALRFPAKYLFALDERPLMRVAQARVNVVACLQSRHLEQPFRELMLWQWGVHATPGYETAPVALEIASGVFGIRRFVMVGFDGYDSGRDDYAKSLNLQPRSGPGGQGGDGSYAIVNRHIDEVALIKGLDLVWWHRGGSAGNLEGQRQLASPRATSS